MGISRRRSAVPRYPGRMRNEGEDKLREAVEEAIHTRTYDGQMRARVRRELRGSGAEGGRLAQWERPHSQRAQRAWAVRQGVESFLWKEMLDSTQVGIDVSRHVVDFVAATLRNYGWSAAADAASRLTTQLRIVEVLLSLLRAPPFRLVEVGGTGYHCHLWLPGFLTEDSDPWESWAPVVDVLPGVEHVAVHWDSGTLTDAIQFALDLPGRIRAAVSLTRAPSIRGFLDVFHPPQPEPWGAARLMADVVGVLLGHLLARGGFGSISLGGFSLGATVATRATSTLGRIVPGRVDRLVTMCAATPMSAIHEAADSPGLAGELVHAYLPSDDVLGNLYPLANWGGSAAGLEPCLHPKARSADLRSVVDGHMDVMPNVARVVAALALAD